jgi:hypothetical protein
MNFCDGQTHVDKTISCHCVRENRISSTTTEQQWIIPLTIVHGQSNGHLNKHLLSKQEERIQISSNNQQRRLSADDREHCSTRKKARPLPVTKSNWLKLNVCSSGPYRVFYSSSMMDKFIEAIRQQELNTYDRFNIENDLYALAMSGFTSLVDYLRLLVNGFVYEDDDELIWKDIESNIVRIGTLLEYDCELFGYYRQYLVDFHRILFQRLGLTPQVNESTARSRLRCCLLVILGK